MKNEVVGSKMDDSEYLSKNFPASMTKKDLIASIKQFEGAYEDKSRNYLVNQLETIILFHIRDDKKSNGYNKLFYTAEEIVDSQFSDNGPELRAQIEKRGVVCPKKVVQRKRLMIDLLRTELGNEVQSAFKTVVQLILHYNKHSIQEADVSTLFTELFHITSKQDIESDQSWM